MDVWMTTLLLSLLPWLMLLLRWGLLGLLGLGNARPA